MSLLFAFALLQGGIGSTLFGLLPFAAIFALFYFMIIMPQRRKQQALQNLLGNLKVGDKVVTSSYENYGDMQELVIKKQ